MKQKYIMVIIRFMLIIAVLAFPKITSAASSEVVKMAGTGIIEVPAKSETEPPESSGVGTISKESAPKTGDWMGIEFYAVMFASSLAAFLCLLLLKWHREDLQKMRL